MRGIQRTNNNTENRSSEVRQRREQRSQQRTKTASTRAVKPVRSKPVIVRGNTFGTPIHQSAGTRRARRQFYVAMDQIGTEMRLPAIPVIRPGWRLLSGLIAIMAIVGLYAMWTSPLLKVANIELVGPVRTPGEEINAASEMLNLTVMEIDPQGVEEKISQAFPELLDVKVSVDLPNYVKISAAERQPVAIWYQGESANWVDAEGFIFPIRGDAGPLLTIESEEDLPAAPLPIDVLTRDLDQEGTVSEEPVDEKAVGLLSMLLPEKKEVEAAPEEPVVIKNVDPEFLRQAQGLSERLNGTTLLYNSENGLGWYDDAGGWQVFIGKDINNFEAKYAMYEGITRALNEQGLRPSLVSVEHLNAPFYRLEQ